MGSTQQQPFSIFRVPERAEITYFTNLARIKVPINSSLGMICPLSGATLAIEASTIDLTLFPLSILKYTAAT